MSEFVKIILKSGKDLAAKRFHPWVFSGAVKKMYGEPAEGDVVEVYSNHDEFLGMGHYQPSSITVRIFSFEKINPDFSFWKNKFSEAYNFRKVLGLTDTPETNVYRLIHAEGDNMPGLIADFYNGVIVLQSHSIGMHRNNEMFTEILKEIYGNKLIAVYDKSSETLPHMAKINSEDKYLFGKANELHEVTEYGNKFYVNWESGQKTGFFIDQRENRNLLRKFVNDKKVLNTFSYTGGFSVYALQAGAAEVYSVDSSKKAMDITEKNIALNNFENGKHISKPVDAFDFLKNIENEFDVIILDPPAFAKHHDVKHNAMQGYKRINLEAMKQIKKGGILFTFSCSQVVDRSLFNSTIMSAAILSGRNVRILHQLSQPADHPFNACHPEGEYLKGLVLYIE
ncbi:MAG TPA: class I SAM-dependent rRNA methyltransferase [Bacteroidales bacterium]|nr:class I SAM-dependent rRNA methyltransferase [Bacteroidales bacterium]HPS16541.1 class I SAM-dependent rRNA methyltransferase [Bacteroidales bacterium]